MTDVAVIAVAVTVAIADVAVPVVVAIINDCSKHSSGGGGSNCSRLGTKS